MTCAPCTKVLQQIAEDLRDRTPRPASAGLADGRASDTVGLVSSYLPALTALLGEQLKSVLPGYTVTLASHPVFAMAEGQRQPRVVVVSIAHPQLELIAWVRLADSAVEPWSEQAVELRAVVYADDPYGGAGSPKAIAALVGDSIGSDDDLPVAEILDAARVLLEDELPIETADLEPQVRAALQQGLRVYLNDPIR